MGRDSGNSGRQDLVGRLRNAASATVAQASTRALRPTNRRRADCTVGRVDQVVWRSVLHRGREKLVVLFTDDPELHREAVSGLTPALERLILRRTSRSRVEVDRANDAVQRALMNGDDPHPNVVSAGLTLDGEEWVIRVGINQYTEQMAADVRELVAPETISVTYEEQDSEY
jgi:hypothetical protein